MGKILLAASMTSLAALARLMTVKLFNRFSFPIDNIIINVLGGFLLGLANHWLFNSAWLMLMAAAFISGYTTFSTFINETIQISHVKFYQAVIYFLLTLILGIGGAWLGNLI